MLLFAVSLFNLIFGTPNYPLQGMLEIPISKKAPCVFIIPGSGRTDCDGTTGENQFFKSLACKLHSQGISTFRFSKRSFVYHTIYPDDVREDIIDDVLLAIKILKDVHKMEQIFLLGHSLGGTVSPLIAKEVIAKEGNIKGVILLGASPRSPYALFMDQIKYLEQNGYGNYARAQRRALKDLRDGKMFLNYPASFWRSWTKCAKKMIPTIRRGGNIPYLIIAGGQDHLVTKIDFQILQAGLQSSPHVRFKWFSDLNHIFSSGSILDYNVPNPLDESVVDTISSWIATSSKEE